MELIFEWDKNKARVNLQKYHVNFEEAKTLFFDLHLLTYPDEIHSLEKDYACTHQFRI